MPLWTRPHGDAIFIPPPSRPKVAKAQAMRALLLAGALVVPFPIYHHG
jgi:hypothetical protein